MSLVVEEIMTMSTRVMIISDILDSVFKVFFIVFCNRYVRKDYVSYNGMYEIKRECTYIYNIVIIRKLYMYM